jgi:hypothetical protein
LGADGIGHYKKKVHITMCLILNGYQDTAVGISRSNSVRFWFIGLDEEQSLQMKGELLALILDLLPA